MIKLTIARALKGNIHVDPTGKDEPGSGKEIQTLWSSQSTFYTVESTGMIRRGDNDNVEDDDDG